MPVQTVLVLKFLDDKGNTIEVEPEDDNFVIRGNGGDDEITIPSDIARAIAEHILEELKNWENTATLMASDWEEAIKGNNV